MMMRSAPAASAHLAEIPVPAPAPSIGIPRAALALHRFRHADRSILLLPPSWQTGPRRHYKAIDANTQVNSLSSATFSAENAENVLPHAEISKYNLRIRCGDWLATFTNYDHGPVLAGIARCLRNCWARCILSRDGCSGAWNTWAALCNRRRK